MDKEKSRELTTDSSLPKVVSQSGFEVKNPIEKLLPKRKGRGAIRALEDLSSVELPSMVSFKSQTTVYGTKEEYKVEKPVMMKEKKSLKGILTLSVVGILLVVAVYCATKVTLWENENEAIDTQLSDIKELVVERVLEPSEEVSPPVINNLDNSPSISTTVDYSKLPLVDVDFSRLKKVNADTKAYIKIDGLDVSTPVVQTTDNKYYLSHSYDKSYNSAGWIFGDYRNDFDNLKQNTIIYGHNRRNYVMFGSLKLIFDKNWYGNKGNHIIYISTEKKNMLFQIFSAYTIPTETYYLANEFETDQEYGDFLNTISSRSKIDFGVRPTTEDKILTLSTCHTSTTKMVVHAKLIKIQDKE